MGAADAKAFGDRLLRMALGNQRQELLHLFGGQSREVGMLPSPNRFGMLAQSMTVPTRQSFRVTLSATLITASRPLLYGRIAHVIQLRASKQMSGIETKGNVTGMAY